jgi:hypothetical protein
MKESKREPRGEPGREKQKNEVEKDTKEQRRKIIWQTDIDEHVTFNPLTS